jgi:hypothetical protein
MLNIGEIEKRYCFIVIKTEKEQIDIDRGVK